MSGYSLWSVHSTNSTRHYFTKTLSRKIHSSLDLGESQAPRRRQLLDEYGRLHRSLTQFFVQEAQQQVTDAPTVEHVIGE